eukprot:126793_1
MTEYIWMFGSLSRQEEQSYALQMTRTFTDHVLAKDAKRHHKQQRLSDCIVSSQEFIRVVLKDTAFVSLRDIARCLKIFVFVYKRSQSQHTKFVDSMIEALALVYYFRLEDQHRREYNEHLSNTNRIIRFRSTLEGQRDTVCKDFESCIPRGIALNRALKENLFLLFR